MSAQNTHNNAGEGDLLAGDPDAAPMGGGQGNPVDGVPSAATMSDNYHVHAFLGLFVNGTEITIPDAVGFVNPFGDYPTTDACTGDTSILSATAAPSTRCTRTIRAA